MKIFGENLVLLNRIAFGGMAEIFRAKQIGHDGFEKTVAVKAIHTHLADGSHFKKMFKIEANLSAKLQHPNIVQVHGSGEFDGQLYLVMEYVDGVNLYDLLKKAISTESEIPLEIASFIISECAEGLDYAHSFVDDLTGEVLNIVHRDVSPQNIMLGYKGEIKLVDFGVVKTEGSEKTQTGVLKGKFSYMTPEQIHGMQLDGRSDIFSLGIVFWEILTKKKLFTADSEIQTIKNVTECRVVAPSTINPKIPKDLDDLVLRALAKKPADRFQSAGDLAQAITIFLNKNYPSFNKKSYKTYLEKVYEKEIKENLKTHKEVDLKSGHLISQLHDIYSKPTRVLEMSNSRRLLDPDATRVSQVKSSVFKKLIQSFDTKRKRVYLCLGVFVLSVLAGLLYKYQQSEYFFSNPDPNLRRLASVPFIKHIRSQTGIKPVMLLTRESRWSYIDNMDLRLSELKLNQLDKLSWKQGWAPLGYGEESARTKLDYGKNPNKKKVSYYFMNKFVLPENTIFHPQVLLRILVDDGAVIYINDREVTRVRMHYGNVGPATLSSMGMGDDEEGEFVEVKFDKDILVKGVNRIVVGVHQWSPGSSDILFDLEIVGAYYE